MKNILILDSGTKVKLVRHFVQQSRDMDILVVAGDCDKTVPALYEADERIVFPEIRDKNYINNIISFCKEKNIDMILPLLEKDLLEISKNKELLKKENITAVVSDYELIRLCEDKKLMNEFLKKKGMPTIETCRSLEEFNDKIGKFPVIVKRKDGCGSIDNHIVKDIDTLKRYINNENHQYIIQPFIESKEIGADVYVDIISKKVVSIFLKEKILMRNGETNKSISIKDEKLFNFIKKYVEDMGLIGPIDIDLFEHEGKYYIFDVNPRFGGGYLHAHACNVNFIEMILNNLCGIENKINIGEYEEGIIMMKYSDVQIISTNDERYKANDRYRWI